MTAISDFNDATAGSSKPRSKNATASRVQVEAADSEIKLDPASGEITVCPTLYWKSATSNS